VLYNKINLFLLRLRDLIKAYDRLARAVPNVRSAEAVFDNALTEVLSLLEDPEINDLLSELIRAARNRLIAAPSDFDHEIEARKQEFVREEASVMEKASIRKRDIEHLYGIYREVKQYREKFPADTSDLKKGIVDLHESTKAKLTESRALNRKEKKKRKRKLAQGITSAIFGIGLIAADTLLPQMSDFSYGLGAGALLQALRDFVGEARD
jgi:hypothetical protein